MSTYSNTPVHSASEQTTNNSTSWVGHAKGDPADVIKGQTFMPSNEGDLQAIEVFSNIVTAPGKVIMTVYKLDEQKEWGNPLGMASLQFNQSDSGKWISFPIKGLHLDKGQSYGFRLESHDSLIGVGEGAGSASAPLFGNGQEWRFVNNDKNGDSFSYLSLAFKVAIKD
ncbi:hypothetical protein [Ferruginibacter sp. HRS2-29]|uniref:hypothetical protein n=1 Tax=Ferruginibacter sp. HRS2-29 TaxID=2487334 RepID=UPI0020CD31DB|nr:hypothetical protein [Ferruginibacter sp. HRS2-29]MCP9751385.1 hypothetical protein [Ferruginibacter sp. HRS2-29]